MSVETLARKKRVRRNIQYGLIAAAAGTGLILTAAMMPNALQLLKYFPDMKLGARFNYQQKKVLTRLKEKGLIEFEEVGGRHYARLTEKGVLFLEREDIKTRMNAYQKRRWDRRWRVVIFDIPERRRSVRDRLRLIMSGYSFLKIQNSVWVYPHDCEEVLALIKADLRLGMQVLYMVVESIENDGSLRKRFGLPLE